jgi:hypothetical protein
MPLSRPHLHKPSGWSYVNALLFLVASILVISQAWLANAQVTSGKNLSHLQQQQTYLTDENDALRLRLAQVSALQVIRKSAEDTLGLKPVTKNIRYIPLNSGGNVPIGTP